LLSGDRRNRLPHQGEIWNRQRLDDIRVAGVQSSELLSQLDEQDPKIVLARKLTVIVGSLGRPEIGFVGFLDNRFLAVESSSAPNLSRCCVSFTRKQNRITSTQRQRLVGASTAAGRETVEFGC
jgi:hypothetical protein